MQSPSKNTHLVRSCLTTHRRRTTTCRPISRLPCPPRTQRRTSPKRRRMSDDAASPSLVPAPSPSASLQRGNPLPRRVRQVWPKQKCGGRVHGEPRRARRAHPQRVPENEYAKTGGGYHARGRGGDAAFMYAVAVGAYTKYGRGGNTGTSVQGPTACTTNTTAAGTRRTRTPRWAGVPLYHARSRRTMYESMTAVRRHDKREWEQRPGMRRHEDRGRRMTV